MLRGGVILLFFVLLPSHVCAEERIALLIGNQVYTPKVGALRNRHEDVALVGAALKQLGFQIKILKDAGYRCGEGATLIPGRREKSAALSLG
jgi:hypothetical protein